MSESELKIEWLFVNLRWFFLVAVAGVIGIEAAIKSLQFPGVVIALLLVGCAANVMTMVALLQNTLSPGIQRMTLLQDIGLTLGFITGSGGTESPLLFFSLIPITTAALRFSRLYGLSVVISVVLAYWAIVWNQHGFALTTPFSTLMTQAFPYFTNGIVLLLAGSAVSQIGVRIKQALTAEREKQEREAQSALESAHQKVRLIFELASTLSATLNYERVLEAALDVSDAGLHEFYTGDNTEISQIGLILLFGMDQTLYVVKARGASTQDERLRFPAQEGALAEAVEKANPVIIDSPRDDPELGKIVAMQSCQQAIVVPLRAGFESYGLLVLGSSEPAVYTPDFQDLLVAICNQAVMALQNATLYQNLTEEKDRLVTVEEDARKKLARNLHDGPTQTIAAIAMRLNYIRMLVTREPEKSIEELQQLEELARKTTKEIRQMLFTLRPLILESQGLIAALQQLKQKVSETDPLPVINLELNKEAESLLSTEAQGAVFYITDEATTNARKYAKAKNLWIRLYRRGMNVITEIEDDGVGFDVAALEANYATRGSLGMINLRERATLVKGKTVIKSAPGQGTKITVTIPVVLPEAEFEP
ncbi:MAG TPA: GAF domain-containing sensor histidine kinase [Anaerolineae bacterium]|nr:GAF domain-containing sensor histidine kinase [Anaerolineae bacterium]HQH38079.1 GAF domain-containing sensor histidine kinase [Anaerolineae bacterium]